MTEPGGVWLLNEATNELTYVETHRGSTIASTWPVGDAETHYAIQRGCDWLLNAAGAGFEAYRAALRARWPGDARGLPVDSKPWQFWHRTFYGLSGGATRRLFMGDLDRATRVNGFTIDDAKDGDTVTGWAGGSAGTLPSVTAGIGSGLGRGGPNIVGGRGGGGGGAATAGAQGTTHVSAGFAGLAVSAYSVLHAVITNNYARDRWLASGGGGASLSSSSTQRQAGGASGGGVVRIGLNSLTESTSRTLTGGNGSAGTTQASGGGGGGVYLAITGGDYTLGAGHTINCGGGNGPNAPGNTTGHGGDGGNGHIIIMAHGDITLSGTTSNAVVTQWRIIAAPPPGGSFVTNP